MPLILSIDASSKSCSVAIHQNGNLLASNELYLEKSAGTMLTSMIQDSMKYAEINIQAIDAIAVAMGPGSYTGLRIAVATAKGLCFSLNKPLIAINTLDTMARQIPVFADVKTLLCPMLDARRMEVYCAIFEAATYNVIMPTQAKIIDNEAFAELLSNHKILFFGDGATKCKDMFAEQANAEFLDKTIYPSAQMMGVLALQAFNENRFEVLADFEPYYLKDFISTTKKD